MKRREFYETLQSLLLFCCLLGGATAQAAKPPPKDPPSLTEMSLEDLMQLPVDVVYTASKYEQKVTRAPASVSIITADEIAKFGYRTLAEVLSNSPGLYATDDRNYTYLGFRGFSRPGDFNTRVLLLVDGHRVNDALYGLMYVGNEALLHVDMIERVEVIRGPGSSIYGNSAIFGVINVITRNGEQINGTELALEASTYDTYRERVTFGKKWTNGLRLALSASYFDSAGHERLYFSEYDDPQTNNGLAVAMDAERAFRFFGSASWKEFTLSGGYSDRFKRPPTAPYGTVFNSQLMETVDRRGYADLKYERGFVGDLQLLVRASYDWYPYDAVFPYENSAPPPDPITNIDASKGQWARGEVQLTKKLFERHTIILGAEYQDNVKLRQQNYDVDPFNSYLDTERRSHNYALYTQAEIALPYKLLINAGLRYDHFKSFGDTTNPRLGLIYNPWQKTTFKALYGEAFRAPSEYEVNYQSVNQVTNQALKPETIRTYELVCEQYLSNTWRLSLSGYRYRIDDLVTLLEDPFGLQIFQNVDQVRVQGGELQLEGRYANGLQVRADFALQDAKNLSTEQRLSNSPRQLAGIDINVPLFRKGLFGGLQFQYRSKALTVGGQSAEGFSLLNLTLLQRGLFGKFDVSGSIYNVFDVRYSLPSAATGEQDVIEQNGRTFRIKAVVKF